MSGRRTEDSDRAADAGELSRRRWIEVDVTHDNRENTSTVIVTIGGWRFFRSSSRKNREERINLSAIEIAVEYGVAVDIYTTPDGWTSMPAVPTGGSPSVPPRVSVEHGLFRQGSVVVLVVAEQRLFRFFSATDGSADTRGYRVRAEACASDVMAAWRKATTR